MQDLYEFEWEGGAADGPGPPPEHAPSGASAPACASCAQVRQRAEGGGPRRNPCPHHFAHRFFFRVLAHVDEMLIYIFTSWSTQLAEAHTLPCRLSVALRIPQPVMAVPLMRERQTRRHPPPQLSIERSALPLGRLAPLPTHPTQLWPARTELSLTHSPDGEASQHTHSSDSPRRIQERPPTCTQLSPCRVRVRDA